tara:strand:- start:30 stop:350 length:321 start_codon:yes stop_codon:yes gene_type:complete
MPYKDKEKERAYQKNYNQANKEKKVAQMKALREARMDGLYTVYLLVNENYVGQTNCLSKRLSKHKNDNGRDISIVHVIGKYKTREEAKTVEAKYHSQGYLGYWRGL